MTQANKTAFTKTAFTWIRDGVLVNRMHINPVAFAVAYWLFENQIERQSLTLEQLVNFAFAQSGISCAEKMTLFEQKYNRQRSDSKAKIESAASFYNSLATEMALSCSFFPGTLPLLSQLQKCGALNFISSAVEQEVLDLWAKSADGQNIASILTEILGKRKNFSKGRDHFAYVSMLAKGGPIYAIADAPVEIAMGSQLSRDFEITNIGFAYTVKSNDVVDAMKLAATIAGTSASLWRTPPPGPILKDQLALQAERLQLPDESETKAALKAAGADHIVCGDAETIMGSLSSILLPIMESNRTQQAQM